MNTYKKIIRSQKLRFKILNSLKKIPDKRMIEMQYRIKLGRKLNINNPKRFTEKLQWYKLYYRNSVMTQCADKYSVREYIISKGLEHTLTKLYAVYDKPEEIEISNLPDKFIMKTTNGSGTNYICTEKSNFNLAIVKNEISNWLQRDIYASGREWCYKDIQPRIIVEELLEDHENRFNGINDYKFLCFNGAVEYVVVDVDRQTEHKRNIYDMDWNFIEVSTDHPNIKGKVEKPAGFNEMLKVAQILCKDFPFVRVDLYWVNGKVYFGELTFYPWTGYVQFFPDKFDYVLGDKFILPDIMN